MFDSRVRGEYSSWNYWIYCIIAPLRRVRQSPSPNAHNCIWKIDELLHHAGTTLPIIIIIIVDEKTETSRDHKIKQNYGCNYWRHEAWLCEMCCRSQMSNATLRRVCAANKQMNILCNIENEMCLIFIRFQIWIRCLVSMRLAAGGHWNSRDSNRCNEAEWMQPWTACTTNKQLSTFVITVTVQEEEENENQHLIEHNAYDGKTHSLCSWRNNEEK